jgi:hypothetical protein
MKTINRHICILTGMVFLLLGCSTTQFTHHSRGIDPPFCKNGLHGSTAVVYWDTAWRHDQKEIERREKMLEEGIRSFFSKTSCVKTVKISRNVGNKPVSLCPEAEIASDARSLDADQAIVIRIEEFGPNLMLYLSPVLWQTKNEVLLRIKILDSRKVAIETDTTSHWYRGGPFMLLGTRNLPRDLDGSLEELFYGIKE